MQIIRTIVWVLILFGMLTFSFFNWEPVEVNLWENLVLETKVPVLVIVAFLIGLVPMWFYHRSVKWSLDRRIRSLEASIKSTALSQQRQEPSAASAGAEAKPTQDSLALGDNAPATTETPAPPSAPAGDEQPKPSDSEPSKEA